MLLNIIRPNIGANKTKRRVGRGIGSGFGKTCGRGHKGQKSRTGGFHKVGFEGGQMPLQRRLPKFGFYSMKGLYGEKVRLSELSALSLNDDANVDLQLLKDNGIVSTLTRHAKVYLSGSIDKKIKLQGISVTKGAKKAIEAAGGSVE